jgi:hypothetical protein
MLLVIRLAPSLTSLEGCTRRGGDVCVGRGGGVSNAARRPNRGLPVVVGCLEGGGDRGREKEGQQRWRVKGMARSADGCRQALRGVTERGESSVCLMMPVTSSSSLARSAVQRSA